MININNFSSILLTGSWTTSSHPDQVIKIHQYLDFILFHMPDGSERAIMTNGNIEYGQTLLMRWIETFEEDGQRISTHFKTRLKVVSENIMEETDSGVKWTRV